MLGGSLISKIFNCGLEITSVDTTGPNQPTLFQFRQLVEERKNRVQVSSNELSHAWNQSETESSILKQEDVPGSSTAFPVAEMDDTTIPEPEPPTTTESQDGGEQMEVDSQEADINVTSASSAGSKEKGILPRILNLNN